MANKRQIIYPFNPNSGSPGRPSKDGGILGKALLPSQKGAYTVDQYISILSKSLETPPQVYSYLRTSAMPDIYATGVIQWPGLAPQSLAKIGKENLAPQIIIGQRTADIERYANYSTHLWKPGWRIEMRHGIRPTKEDLREIQDARMFLENCNVEITNAIERDKAKYSNFRTFLSSVVRDSLTFDGIAIWTDREKNGAVKSFKPLSAQNIRLVGKEGYKEGVKKFNLSVKEAEEIFAVLVDETGTVTSAFNRDQLFWSVRNPRLDPISSGYGYSEIEIAVRLISAYQNALDTNSDVFEKNSIPNGILMLKGMGWNQKQLDVLARVWSNMKMGVSKFWTVPAIAVPKDGEMEILDLSRMKGMEAYYQDFMNMVAGAFCLVYKFPYQRLGYRTSGSRDPTKVPEESNRIIDETDVGLPVLLGQIETPINEYLIWSRWPHLQFSFTGKNPKEDAREFEERSLARTAGERRASSGLPSMVDLVKDLPKEFEEFKKSFMEVAIALDLAPTDPSLIGAYQAIMAAKFGNANGEGSSPEAPFNRKKDPAKSEQHGAVSGIRRDSAEEKGK